jgi:hypothetical protein
MGTTNHAISIPNLQNPVMGFRNMKSRTQNKRLLNPELHNPDPKVIDLELQSPGLQSL